MVRDMLFNKQFIHHIKTMVHLIFYSAGENEHDIIAFCSILFYFYHCYLAY
jgi:hypothetical protein